MRALAAAALICLLLGTQSLGQVVERPVAFDSEGRLMTMTPPIAERLGLAPPVWPVAGSYMEARLFSSGDGQFVLVVNRENGEVERYSLSGEEYAELSRTVAAATAVTGRLTTVERPDQISMPARSQFVRNQTIGGAIVYAPSLATFPDDGAAKVSTYWAALGTTFFITATLSKGRTVSKAQNHMATDGIYRGALIGNAMLYVIDTDQVDSEAVAASVLCGSLGGTILGYRAGRDLTDGEARSATFGSTFAAAVAGGAIASAGGFQGDEAQAEVAGLVGASLAGIPLGLRYARGAPYGVTAGDVDLLATGSFLGAFGFSTFIADGDVDERAAAAVVTAGFITGALLTDRQFVRRYDFTEGEGRLMSLGTLAGGLVGMSIPLAADADDARAFFGAGTAGAIAGMLLTGYLISPRDDSQIPSETGRVPSSP